MNFCVTKMFYYLYKEFLFYYREIHFLIKTNTFDNKSKIEKVPRGIRGEKSSKDKTNSMNLISTIESQTSPKMGGRNQVSGRVSASCWHATSVAMLHESTHNWVEVKVDIKVMKWVESLIGWEVTVGQGSECHLTFMRGKLHIAE